MMEESLDRTGDIGKEPGMALLRRIVREPFSSDERQGLALFVARIRKSIVPAGPLVANVWSAPMAGTRIGGGGRISGGNPGPVGDSTAPATFD